MQKPPIENPILVYKINNKVTYKWMCARVGLTARPFYAIRKMKPAQMLGLKVGTIMRFKQRLNIDLLEYIKEYTHNNTNPNLVIKKD
jgi:hypothetical protein